MATHYMITDLETNTIYDCMKTNTKFGKFYLGKDVVTGKKELHVRAATVHNNPRKYRFEEYASKSTEDRTPF